MVYGPGGYKVRRFASIVFLCLGVTLVAFIGLIIHLSWYLVIVDYRLRSIWWSYAGGFVADVDLRLGREARELVDGLGGRLCGSCPCGDHACSESLVQSFYQKGINRFQVRNNCPRGRC